MAKLTLNNLLDMTKTHSEEQLKEICLPWFVAYATAIYHKELIDIGKKRDGVFIRTVTEEIGRFEFTTADMKCRSLESLGMFIMQMEKKQRGISFIHKTVVTSDENTMLVLCNHTAIQPTKCIPYKAADWCDKFVFRLYHAEQYAQLKSDYANIQPYITDK